METITFATVLQTITTGLAVGGITAMVRLVGTLGKLETRLDGHERLDEERFMTLKASVDRAVDICMGRNKWTANN